MTIQSIVDIVNFTCKTKQPNYSNKDTIHMHLCPFSYKQEIYFP